MQGFCFRMTKPPLAASPVAFIYLLRDPNTDEPRYIGSSSDPVNRYKSHISDAMKHHRRAARELSAKAKWIVELNVRGQFPILEVVACVPVAAAIACERSLYESAVAHGWNLTNGVIPNGNGKEYSPSLISA